MSNGGLKFGEWLPEITFGRFLKASPLMKKYSVDLPRFLEKVLQPSRRINCDLHIIFRSNGLRRKYLMSALFVFRCAEDLPLSRNRPQIQKQSFDRHAFLPFVFCCCFVYFICR